MMSPKGKSTKTLQRAGEEGVSPGGWGEGIMILSYIRGPGQFRGSNFDFNIILFFPFFLGGVGGGGVRKMNIFWGETGVGV